MQVSRELAYELLELWQVGDQTTGWEDDSFAGFARVDFKLVHSELVDTGRWSHIYERVYQDLSTGKYWSTSYSTGATECQDESPYEYDGDVIKFTEVVPVEHTVVKYEETK